MVRIKMKILVGVLLGVSSLVGMKKEEGKDPEEPKIRECKKRKRSQAGSEWLDKSLEFSCQQVEKKIKMDLVTAACCWLEKKNYGCASSTDLDGSYFIDPVLPSQKRSNDRKDLLEFFLEKVKGLIRNSALYKELEIELLVFFKSKLGARDVESESLEGEEENSKSLLFYPIFNGITDVSNEFNQLQGVDDSLELVKKSILKIVDKKVQPVYTHYLIEKKAGCYLREGWSYCGDEGQDENLRNQEDSNNSDEGQSSCKKKERSKLSLEQETLNKERLAKNVKAYQIEREKIKRLKNEAKKEIIQKTLDLIVDGKLKNRIGRKINIKFGGEKRYFSEEEEEDDDSIVNFVYQLIQNVNYKIELKEIETLEAVSIFACNKVKVFIEREKIKRLKNEAKKEIIQKTLDLIVDEKLKKRIGHKINIKFGGEKRYFSEEEEEEDDDDDDDSIVNFVSQLIQDVNYRIELKVIETFGAVSIFACNQVKVFIEPEIEKRFPNSFQGYPEGLDIDDFDSYSSSDDFDDFQEDEQD